MTYGTNKQNSRCNNAYLKSYSKVSMLAFREYIRPYTCCFKSAASTILSHSSHLVSLTMLPISHSLRKMLQTLQQRALSSASSGVSVATAPLAQTRTLSRSSVTILTSTFRHTSSMTPRRQVVSLSHTCVLVISLSRALTTSTRLTLLPVTTRPTYSRVTRWSTT